MYVCFQPRLKKAIQSLCILQAVLHKYMTKKFRRKKKIFKFSAIELELSCILQSLTGPKMYINQFIIGNFCRGYSILVILSMYPYFSLQHVYFNRSTSKMSVTREIPTKKKISRDLLVYLVLNRIINGKQKKTRMLYN